MNLKLLLSKMPIFALLICLSIVVFGCQQSNAKETKDHLAMKENTEHTIDNLEVFRHIVLFKFKETATEDEVSALNDQFNELSKSIDVIKDFEWGLNDSPENLDQGFTHCYILTFNSVEDRDGIYAPHPDHQKFVSNLQPHLEKVLVVDYKVE